jgi:signal transduction histidine kinase
MSPVSPPHVLPGAAFDGLGISVWIEDWSEVGRAVRALREAGTDPLEHLDTTPGALARLHATVRVKDVNDFTLALMGMQNKQGLIGPLATVVPDSAQTFSRWFAALCRGDRFYRFESQVRQQDGGLRDCLVMAVLPQDPEGLANLLVCVVDITGYKADQLRLAEAERAVERAFRTSAMGVVTAAIAHEVNNPLAAAVTNAEAALRWLRRASPDIAEAEAAIAAAIGDALRARDVVDRTRLLLNNMPAEKVALDPHHVIRNAARFVQLELHGADAALRPEVAPHTPRLLADPVQVQQILTNLLLNAAQTLADHAGPRDIDLCVRPHPAGVLVEVADSGPGIPPDRLTRIFEPFYSTRTGGIGLGLAICRAAAEAQGGRIWATSPPGRGARFHVLLPAAS